MEIEYYFFRKKPAGKIMLTVKARKIIKINHVFISLLIIFNLIFKILPEQIVYRAEVLITRGRSISNQSFSVQVRGACKSWNLYLSPMKSIWSEFAQAIHVTRDNNGQRIYEKQNIPKDLPVYHDIATGSILSVRSGEVFGVLDEDTTVVCEDKNHYIIKLDRNSTGSIDNVFLNDTLAADFDNETESNFISRRSFNWANNKTYVPEITVIVDSELAGIIGGNLKVYDYVQVFFSKVESRFDSIKNPKIDLRLLQVFIIRNASDEPYITDNLWKGKYIQAAKLRYELSKWVFDPKNMPSNLDVTFLLTNKDLTVNENDEASLLAVGVSWVRGACKYDRNAKIAYGVGVAEDQNAAFQGTYYATHELGHLFGAEHDDIASLNCDEKDGYIMSPIYKTSSKNTLLFSNCSIKSMVFYMDNEGSCTSDDNLELPYLFNITDSYDDLE